jgi:CheY-like chemotaxis protein
MFLPDMEGWRVLDRLKHDLLARHIPVCVISTDDSRERALHSGAMAFIVKPIQSREILDQALNGLYAYVTRASRRILLIMPDSPARAELIRYISEDDIEITTETGAAAIEQLRANEFDCVVLDEQGAAVQPADLINVLPEAPVLGPLPVILYRKDGGDDAQESLWQRSEDSFTLLEARSLPRLFDMTLSVLHRSAARLPEEKRRRLEELHESNRPLANKKALIVDDDMRNIFALATVLEEHGMVHVWADNGRDAIRLVESDPAIDIVLMDIMMPEMDGMDTMQEIRKLPQGKDLPMIAVTAKAMKGDREKCIEAGAWDYLSKPVNTMDLLTVLRAWLHR